MNILIVLLSFISFIAVNYIGSLAIEYCLISFFQDNGNIMIIYQIGSHLVTCLLAFPVYLAINRASFVNLRLLFHRNNKIKPLNLLLVTVALLVSVSVPMFIIHSFLPALPMNSPDIITCIWLIVITPVIEEIMFRGVALQKLKKYGKVCAVLLSSFLFSLGHLNNAGNMLISFIPGIILAVIAIKTKSIFYTIPLHMLVNLCGSVILPIILCSQSLV